MRGFYHINVSYHHRNECIWNKSVQADKAPSRRFFSLRLTFVSENFLLSLITKSLLMMILFIIIKDTRLNKFIHNLSCFTKWGRWSSTFILFNFFVTFLNSLVGVLDKIEAVQDVWIERRPRDSLKIPTSFPCENQSISREPLPWLQLPWKLWLLFSKRISTTMLANDLSQIPNNRQALLPGGESCCRSLSVLVLSLSLSLILFFKGDIVSTIQISLVELSNCQNCQISFTTYSVGVTYFSYYSSADTYLISIRKFVFFDFCIGM